jgi:methyltransferase, FkbM family
MKLTEKLRDDFERGHLNKREYVEKMWKCHEVLFGYSDFLLNTDVSSVTLKDGRVAVSFRSFPIALFIPKDDRSSVPIMAINFREYEKQYAFHMMEIMKGRRVFFDIGANVGYYSMIASKLYPHMQIYSFEPVPRTFCELEANVKLNEAENVRPIPIALSDRVADAVIFYDEKEAVAASFRDIRERKEAVARIDVKTTTLDVFCECNNVFPDFIKCDVEGAELDVFKGSVEVLKHSKPIIFVEILRKWCAKFGHRANDVLFFLKEFGYVANVLKNGSVVPVFEITDETEDTNFIFIPK